MKTKHSDVISAFARGLLGEVDTPSIGNIIENIEHLEEKSNVTPTNEEQAVFHRLRIIGINTIITGKRGEAHEKFLKKIESIYKNLPEGQNVNSGDIENALKDHQDAFTQETQKKLKELKNNYNFYTYNKKLSLEHCGSLTTHNIDVLIKQRWEQYHSINDILDVIGRFELTDKDLPSKEELHNTRNKLEREIETLELAKDKLEGVQNFINNYKNKHVILSKLNLIPVFNEISQLKVPTLNDLQEIGEQAIASSAINQKEENIFSRFVNWLVNIFSAPLETLKTINDDLKKVQEDIKSNVEQFKGMKSILEEVRQKENENEDKNDSSLSI